MITFSKFGTKGRLGNQLFHLAGLIGLSKKYNQELRLPAWRYAKFFNTKKYAVDASIKGFKLIREKDEFYHMLEHWDPIASGNWDVDAWLQTEKYWQHCIESVKDALTWEPGFKKSVLDKYPIDFSRAIAISVRRGDYVGNINYDQLPISYYMQALMQEFPDYLDRQILIFSDDIPYCKIHFEGLPNVWFADPSQRTRPDLGDVVQLCLMSQCSGFVIANSTFSWWGAYLAELRDPTVKIVRPAYLFDGPLLAKSDSRDHWPERWVKYDHKNPDGSFKKYNLKDVTFTIPVMHDHSDRRHNLDLNVCLLQRVFDTNVAIGELATGTDPEFKFSYFQDFGCHYYLWNRDFFHRTRMLNEMGMLAETPIIANWDADVCVPEVQTLVAVEMIRRGLADGVYPYDGRFARVPRADWFKPLEKTMDVGIFKDSRFVGSYPSHHSVGGAVIWNKEKFFEGGGENENFISHAPEDAERWTRYPILGYRIKRVTGQLFHMDHWIGPNSSNRHGYKKQNDEEFHRGRSMDTPEKMWAYVKSWPWYGQLNSKA